MSSKEFCFDGDESAAALEATQEIILASIVDSMAAEVCLEAHRALHTGCMTLDEIYDVIPLGLEDSVRPRVKVETGMKIFSVGIFFVAYDIVLFIAESSKPTSSSAHLMLVNCPVCEESVSGHRFAPHLEKCLRGGKRGSKRASFAELMLPYTSSTKIKTITVDPYPNSRIVRIKMRNGGESYTALSTLPDFELTRHVCSVPKVNQIREGVSEKEFADCRLEVDNSQVKGDIKSNDLLKNSISDGES